MKKAFFVAWLAAVAGLNVFIIWQPQKVCAITGCKDTYQSNGADTDNLIVNGCNRATGRRPNTGAYTF
jgi:hypothetical protein